MVVWNRRTSNGALNEFVTVENGVETRYVGDCRLDMALWRSVMGIAASLKWGAIAEEAWQGMPNVLRQLIGTFIAPEKNGLPPDEDGGWQGLLEQIHISDERQTEYFSQICRLDRMAAPASIVMKGWGPAIDFQIWLG